MVAAANEWVVTVALHIWKADGKWEFDDKNQTDLPSFTATITNGWQDVTIPTSTLKLDSVLLRLADGTWRKLDQVDVSEQELPNTEQNKPAGIPTSYDIRGNSIIFDCPVDTSLLYADKHIKVYIARNTKTFSIPTNYTTADPTTPGFDPLFHDIICYGIAHDYLRGNENKSKADDYYAFITVKLSEVEQHYSAKNRDKKNSITPKTQRVSFR